MESEEPGGTAALSWADSGWPEARGKTAEDSAAAAVAVLYQHHAVGLIRLAYLMLGDRAGAEDAVQDAFCGLYRHWDRLADRDRALAYRRRDPRRPAAAAALVLAVAAASLNILAGYQYEQVMYASATGNVLVVSGARKGKTAGILRGDRYTPIPWDRHIVTAIW